MYLEHFSLKERPFSISPDPRFLFMSNRYREALAHLTYGVEDGGGFVLLTGEVGTGKTTVCRCLLQQLPEKTRLAFVLNPKLNSVELLATICDELGIEYPEHTTSLKTLTDRLSDYLLKCYEQGLSVVVMIDEAQNIDTEVLEQIRLLTNLETNQKKLLQIILVGQPELQEKLAKRELRQLAQRITARYHLRPLDLKETIAYVLHRVRIAGSRESLFSRKSIELLHVKAMGIPRLINTICDRALVAACSRKMNQVNPKIMQDAIVDVLGGNLRLDEIGVKKNTNISRNIFMGLTLVSLFILVFWLGQRSNKSNPVTDTASVIQTPAQQISSSLLDGESILVTQETIQENTEPQIVIKKSRSPSLIDRMLGNERWDNNGLWSMQQLMKLWNLEYSLFSDGPACQFAANYGLICETLSGNWQLLRAFNRPATLKFSAGLQGEFWGTLSKLSGAEATLQFGEKTVEIRLDELSTIWTGEFQLLWQAPDGYQVDLKVGDRGRAVFWLSEKMNQLVDGNLQSSEIFDQGLQNMVSDYQRKRNITADGIAGMQTILTINSETLDGIPLLQVR